MLHPWRSASRTQWDQHGPAQIHSWQLLSMLHRYNFVHLGVDDGHLHIFCAGQYWGIFPAFQRCSSFLTRRNPAHLGDQCINAIYRRLPASCGSFWQHLCIVPAMGHQASQQPAWDEVPKQHCRHRLEFLVEHPSCFCWEILANWRPNLCVLRAQKSESQFERNHQMGVET